MRDPELWVLACAPYDRTDEARDLFETLGTPLHRRVLVTTLPDPVVDDSFAHLVWFTSDELNISKWWNDGLDFIEEAARSEGFDQWDVLVAETDARMRPGDVETLRKLMRGAGAVMAGGDWENTLDPGMGAFYRTSNKYSPYGRIPGIMKVVAGETGIRHDPEYRWWLADDDYEWEHRVQGGTLLVEGIPVYHTGTQGPLTGDRKKFWEEDQIKFQEKWGGLPATMGIVEGNAP